MDWERSPFATAPITRATSAVGWAMSSISSLTARSFRFPSAACAANPSALVDLAFLADDLGQPFEFLGDLLVERDDFVEQDRDVLIHAFGIFG